MLSKLFLLLPLLVATQAAPTNNTSYDVTSGTKVQLKDTPAVGVSWVAHNIVLQHTDVGQFRVFRLSGVSKPG